MSVRGRFQAITFAGVALALLLLLALAPRSASANPSLNASCGVDMVLVMDTSASINCAALTQSRTVFNQFVSAFLPSTPSQIGFVEFDTTATVRQGFTSNTTLLSTAIGNTASGGTTNWQDALLKARTMFPNRQGVPKIIVFASDGAPNTINGNQGPVFPTTASVAMQAAITQANLAMDSGIRIITLGIGSGVDEVNLIDISSADAYYSTDFANVAANLANVANDTCTGNVTVEKIIDLDGNPATLWDQSAGQGWSFTASVNTSGANSDDSVVAPATANTDTLGKRTFGVNLGANLTAIATITETPQSGFALISASCTGADNNGSQSGNGVTGIQMTSDDVVNCKFYNQPPAIFTVSKAWLPQTPNPDPGVSVTVTCASGTVAEGAQTVTAAASKIWTVSGFVGNPTCTAIESAVLGYTGSGSPSGRCSGALLSPAGSCTITNTRNDTTFTVNKIWSDAPNPASVSVTVACTGGGTVVEGAQLVSTASPKTWNIQGYTSTPTCSATESPIPTGYTASGSPAGTCSGTAPGSCTITNTLNRANFTVNKIWNPANAATVSVTLTCTGGGTVSAGAQSVGSASPQTWTVSGFSGTPTCTATEAIPAGYSASGSPAGPCSGRVLCAGSCTITHTRNDTTLT